MDETSTAHHQGDVEQYFKLKLSMIIIPKRETYHCPTGVFAARLYDVKMKLNEHPFVDIVGIHKPGTVPLTIPAPEGLKIAA